MKKAKKLTELKIKVYEDRIVLTPKIEVTQYQVLEIICALLSRCPQSAFVSAQSILMDYEKKYRIIPAEQKDK